LPMRRIGGGRIGTVYTGRMPRVQSPPVSATTGVPRACDAIVSRALQQESDLLYPSAIAMRHAPCAEPRHRHDRLGARCPHPLRRHPSRHPDPPCPNLRHAVEICGWDLIRLTLLPPQGVNAWPNLTPGLGLGLGLEAVRSRRAGRGRTQRHRARGFPTHPHPANGFSGVHSH
jgi:hypothetical protein